MAEQNYFNDESRVQALRALHLLDTPAEERFDRYTRLAASAFNAPIALISLVDDKRQWFKSRHGLDACETPRSIAFCSHAVAMDSLLLVPDAALDSRFKDNPLVTAGPGVRFYAGHPIHSVDGQPVGTLCVIDTVPRDFGVGEQRMLRDLAAMVHDEINKHVLVASRDAAHAALADLNAHLEGRVLDRTRQLNEKNELLLREIRHREAVELSLRHNKQRVRNIIETSMAAFVGVDADGQITEWNPAAQKLFGWTQAEALGNDMEALIIPPRMRSAHASGMARFLATGEAKICNQRIELPALTRDGSERIVEMSVNSFEVDGKVFLAAFMQDVSERVAAQHALRDKERLLDAILESVDVGVIACDAAGRITLVNRAARKLHGTQAPADAEPALTAAQTVLPEARTPLRRALAGEVVANMSLQVQVPDARSRMVLASGRPMKGSGGELLGAVLGLKDVTELAESRTRILENEERLRTIADNVPAMIAYIGTDLRYQFANQRYADWLGLDPAAMVGRTVEQALGPAFLDERQASLAACMAGRMSEAESEVRHAGQVRLIRSTYIPHTRDGAVRGGYVFSTDATAARQHERQLHALAHTDHLTGLPNRRAYEERLVQAIDRAHRNGSPLALVYLDVDHFKQINDTLGHAAGDVVLREFAQRLAGTVRVTDAVARLAGDEFVIVLEQVHSALECESIGRKLLDAIRPTFFVEGRILPVTTSIGVAWSARPDKRRLAEGADRALYGAKAAGRDTACVETVGEDDVLSGEGKQE